MSMPKKMSRKCHPKYLGLFFGIFLLLAIFPSSSFSFSEQQSHRPNKNLPALSPPVIPLPFMMHMKVTPTTQTLHTAESKCGNYVVDYGEQCDDGNLHDGDGCSSLCKREAKCGNGILEIGEQCDDDNLANGDGCSSLCKTEQATQVVVQTGCTTDAQCDDGNLCNGTETCSNGTCVAGMALSCGDDGNVCTTESCSPAQGCISTNNSKPCNDSNACTTNDTCSGGVCGGSSVVCQANYACQEGTCVCTHPSLSIQGGGSGTVGQTVSFSLSVSCGASGEEEAEAWQERAMDMILGMRVAFADTSSDSESENQGFMLNDQDQTLSSSSSTNTATLITTSSGITTSTNVDFQSNLGNETNPVAVPNLASPDGNQNFKNQNVAAVKPDGNVNVVDDGTGPRRNAVFMEGVYGVPPPNSGPPPPSLAERLGAAQIEVAVDSAEKTTVSGASSSSSTMTFQCIHAGDSTIEISVDTGKGRASQSVTLHCDCPNHTPLANASGDCETCPDETPLFSGGKCKICPSAQPIFNGESCVACPDARPVFDASLKSCIACPGDKPLFENGACKACATETPLFKDGKCQTCPDSLPIFDGTHNECKPCPPETPIFSNNQCNACPSDKPLFDSQAKKCISCPDSEPFFDPAAHRCKACPADNPYFDKGSCKRCAKNEHCADQDVCTTNEICDTSGECKSDQVPGCFCNQKEDCIDHDICTTDSCVNHVCQHNTTDNCPNTCEKIGYASTNNQMFCPQKVDRVMKNDATGETISLTCFSDLSCESGYASSSDACQECVDVKTMQCDGKTARCYKCSDAQWDSPSQDQACKTSGYAGIKAGQCVGTSTGSFDAFGQSVQNQTPITRKKNCALPLLPKPGLSNPVKSENLDCCKCASITSGSCSATSCSATYGVESCQACLPSVSTCSLQAKSSICSSSDSGATYYATGCLSDTSSSYYSSYY